EEIVVPARTVWMVNGNNVQLAGDLARRTYVSRIDPQMALPWQRDGFLHPDLEGWVQTNRGNLVAAALTLTRGWICAGSPLPVKCPQVGGFENWRDTVAGILEYAGITEFMANSMAVYLEADTELRQWEAFLSILHEVFQSNPWTVADLKLRLDRENEGVTDYSVQILDTLPDQLSDAFVDTRRSFSRTCGRFLSRQEGRRFPSGYMIQRGQSIHRAMQWIVVHTTTEVT
ncbi:MAG: hypothetical protein KAW93_00870, partial [Methanogenium sp.]|nr:hypothetical protein [Methanogenium sp.]